MKRFVRSGIKSGFRALGYEIKPLIRKPGGYYIDAKETIKAAQERGISIREYVESLWKQPGRTVQIIETMREVGCLVPCDRVCEIGPGTGRYLELVLGEIAPKQYDVYEISEDWAGWLEDTFKPIVVRQPTDGRTLSNTPSRSCGLIHAHGVFVYLSLLHGFEYFSEMIRVCKKNGHVVFDFYSEEEFDINVIREWLTTPERYPVILPRQAILQYFFDAGFTLMSEFNRPHACCQSRYLILKKTT
jgi:hypothetical protein